MSLVCVRKRNGMKPAPSAWNALADLERDFGRIFDQGSWMPAVNFSETEEAYELEAELPGMTKDDVELSITDNVVTLKGERKDNREAKGRGYWATERRYGSFERTFELANGVDANNVEARFEHGILKVIMPKPETAKPKRIEVQVK